MLFSMSVFKEQGIECEIRCSVHSKIQSLNIWDLKWLRERGVLRILKKQNGLSSFFRIYVLKI
ncbi:hypothetical protein DLM75_19870 [Leptospira stimsonii]|uniref:Uncharacterized protein n=1 Tax=Leptospira stimsonii TaxID=2202203 RepID=A0A396YV48_9LEPT|nr:hypothetical protein DLM75_19870 [Leptospira stimsonii]